VVCVVVEIGVVDMDSEVVVIGVVVVVGCVAGVVTVFDGVVKGVEVGD